MKKLLFGFLLLFIPLVACGRGTSDRITPLNFASASQAIIAEQDLIGSADLELTTEARGDQLVLTIGARNASNLRGILLTIRLPEGNYRLVEVSDKGFIGAEGEVITFAIEPNKSILPLAIVRINYEDVEGSYGSGVIAQIRLARMSSSASRYISLAPTGDENVVNDLTAIPTGNPNEYTLIWHEKNVGDYNNDGRVDIADVAPLAQNFMKTREQASDQEQFDILDGDGNNKIDIGDITPLAQHFFTEVAGYNVYIGSASSPTDFVSRPDDVPSNRRAEYTYGPVSIADASKCWVEPCDSSGNQGVMSEPAVVSGGGGPPAPPTGIYVEVGEIVGIGNVYIRWDRNSEPDIQGYRIYRRIQGQTDFGQPVAQTSASENEYIDTGLTIETYEYGVTAFNTRGEESAFSEIAQATPYFPPPPDVPMNLVATGEGLTEGTIEVTWEYSSSIQYLAGFELERKAESEADFVLIAEPSPDTRSYTDAGLTVGTLYTYRIRAVDIWGRASNYSNESSSTPGEQAAQPPHITSLTSDRYTFGPEGGTATLTAEVDQPDVTFTWAATAGEISGTGSSVTWTPPPIDGSARVTITCTVENAAGQDTAQLQLILTTLAIEGPAIDFTLPSRDAPNPVYLGLQDYLKDNYAVLLDFGDTW